MALRKFEKCERCGKGFEAGSWNCADGTPHAVEEKTYYVDCPVQDIQDRKHAQVRVYVTKERSFTNSVGEKDTVPARMVIFNRGRYTTCDPEEQLFLDVYGGCISEERWREVYLTEVERHLMSKAKLEAENQKLLDERNALLEQIKEAKGKK